MLRAQCNSSLCRSGDLEPWYLREGKHDIETLLDFVARYAERAAATVEAPGIHSTQAIMTINDKGFILHLYFSKAWGTSFELFTPDDKHFAGDISIDFASELLRSLDENKPFDIQIDRYLV